MTRTKTYSTIFISAILALLAVSFSPASGPVSAVTEAQASNTRDCIYANRQMGGILKDIRQTRNKIKAARSNPAYSAKYKRYLVRYYTKFLNMRKNKDLPLAMKEVVRWCK
jgi:hypothetical protein